MWCAMMITEPSMVNSQLSMPGCRQVFVKTLVTFSPEGPLWFLESPETMAIPQFVRYMTSDDEQHSQCQVMVRCVR